MWTKQFGTSDALPAMCMGFYQTWRNGLRFVGTVATHRLSQLFLLEPKEKLVIFISYNGRFSKQDAHRNIDGLR